MQLKHSQSKRIPYPSPLVLRDCLTAAGTPASVYTKYEHLLLTLLSMNIAYMRLQVLLKLKSVATIPGATFLVRST
jgi:hypothetical protein